MVCHKIKYALMVMGMLGVGTCLDAQDVLVTGLEQLAALKGYIHTAEEGYRIVTDGLHVIGDIKGGEVDLHRLFFGSLRTVDEAVGNNPELTAAYEEAAATKQLFDQAVTTYAASGWLHPQEEQYVAGVGKKVVDELDRQVAALRTLTRDEALSMTDGERLRGIQDIRAAIHWQYIQVAVFLVDVGSLVTGRAKEQTYIGTLKQWYGIQ